MASVLCLRLTHGELSNLLLIIIQQNARVFQRNSGRAGATQCGRPVAAAYRPEADSRATILFIHVTLNLDELVVISQTFFDILLSEGEEVFGEFGFGLHELLEAGLLESEILEL